MENSNSNVSSDRLVRGNGLKIQAFPEGLEKVYDYEQGGHHPVHLGDALNGRYHVVHRLGSGGFANVWLCRDASLTQPRYFAVKILMAEFSTSECQELRINRLVNAGCDKEPTHNYIAFPVDQFEIQGPNGVHYAFVYPVLGPRVSKLPHIVKSSDDAGPALRKICRETTEAMATLHAHGICHGDFRSANIMTRITGLDGLSEDNLQQIFGSPDTVPVLTNEDKKHSLDTAPSYLVYPINWEAALLDAKHTQLATGSACVTDFGECFDMASPPSELGIPQAYQSPEQVLDQKISKNCDLWALGCTLFEIRTGRKLFDTFDDDPDEHLWKVVKILGRFPEPWWSETWAARKTIFQDEVDTDGKAVEVPYESQRSPTDLEPEKKYTVVYQVPEPTSLQDAISRGLLYYSASGMGDVSRDIGNEETELFAALLQKLLSYCPEERLGASEVLQHSWFKM